MAKKKTDTAAEGAVVHSIKGFDQNLQCRGYQFEAGKTYTHKGVIRACENGFHACTTEAHPFEVFSYYPPAGSRYFEVQQSGATHSDDNIKLASAVITIGVEISIHDLIKRAWDYVWSRAIKSDESHVTGDYGAASSTGDYGAASSTGTRGAASSTGTRGAASSTGTRGAAMASGFEGKVKGAEGNAIFAVERNNKYEIVSVAAGIAGRDGTPADTWLVAKNGKLVPAA
ncbi:DUF7666 domain-containing protein [Sphingobium sp. CCH11-B1]|uniref:DUF7666 domain-containing protein n=1 Tax=Sphingobium sp. CCH11-B1 TaxID=1768781 RepID=UPI0008312A81|nr:hypothetical protein [Sphingobium sp. CCH11-B1]